MAGKAKRGAGNTQSGVSGNGGNDQGGSAAPDANGNAGSGGSGDGGDGGSDIIRPTLNGNGDGNDNGDGNGGPGERRERSDKGKSRASYKPRGSKAEISVTSLADVIAFAHLALATVVKNDAWSLDDGESQRLAGAAQKVLRHYDTPAFSAQAMDWIGLVMVAGQIYGTRIIASRAVSKPAPKPENRPQRASEPTTKQEDGTVLITDPMGSGQMIRVPVSN